MELENQHKKERKNKLFNDILNIATYHPIAHTILYRFFKIGKDDLEECLMNLSLHLLNENINLKNKIENIEYNNRFNDTIVNIV